MATAARVTSERIPLELTVEVIGADGRRQRWDANQREAGDRLTGKTFSTKVGEGFSTGGGRLARRIDLDYPDLHLVDTVAFVGADGSVAYEGRLSEMPRELGDTHSIGVTLTGWMAHAKDRKFTEIYVDRDLGSWSGISVARRGVLLTTNATPVDGSVGADPTDYGAAITTVISGSWVAPYFPTSEMWYNAGDGCRVAHIRYQWRRGGQTGDASPWLWTVGVADNDKGGAETTAGNLVATGPTSGDTYNAPTARQWGLLRFAYNGTPAGSAGVNYELYWPTVAVYGDHRAGLVDSPDGGPAGVRAGDVIRNLVSRFCPKLNTDGVVDTTFVIPHLTFKDGTYPYDAFLEVNKYHLWHLAVWENRTLHYRPYDLRDYDWEVRTDDPGVTFSPQGPSTEAIFNGATVTYTDVLTGTKKVLTPGTNPELTDLNPYNPWNAHGIDHWDDIQLSSPTTRASALQLGRAILGDKNRPKAPGSITVKGYVKDRAGNDQPGWKVRAGDTVAVTSFPNDQPRLITETQWDDESKTLSLSVDRPPGAIDAVLDRLSGALSARGLT